MLRSHGLRCGSGSAKIGGPGHPPGNEPFGGKLLDLVMLLIPGGKERTEDEYRTLLDEAGLELSRIVPTSTEISVIEGRKR